jgi:DNA-binding CsgD family transcriptional regulator
MRAESWSEAFGCAAQFAPADLWRKSLAEALRKAANATFSVVCTCPPGIYVEPAAAADPPAFGRVIEQIMDEFLPKVDRAGDGVAMAELLGPGAYAPLDLARDQSLATRFRNEVLAPLGVNGMLNSFLLGRNKEVLGWLAVGTPMSSSEAMEQLAGPLTELSVKASVTLQAALDLAAACGVTTPPSDAKQLNKLSVREREVARLVAQGFSDVAIAALLELSEGTVGVHLRRAYEKVGVRSRSELLSKLGTLLNRGASKEANRP